MSYVSHDLLKFYEYRNFMLCCFKYLFSEKKPKGR